MLLHQLLSGLTEDDFQAFIAYLNRRNRRSDVKNIQLVKLLRQQRLPSRPDRTIYRRDARNAFHALCKRTFDNFIDFTAGRSFETETSEELSVFKGLLAARIFYENQQDLAAKKVLKRAEQMAIDIDLYAGLNEIYLTKIQYADRHPELELEQCIREFTANQAQYRQEQQLNLAYATLKDQLSKGRPFSATLEELITEVFDRFEIDLDRSLSFKALFQLMEISNTLAHHSHDFYGALPLITRLEQVLHQNTKASTKQLYYRIYCLYFLANAYFRTKNFDVAKGYIERLETAITLENGRYFKRFRESALLLKVLYQNYTGNALQAIARLEMHQSEQHPMTPDLVMSLTVFYLQQHQFKKALASQRLLEHTSKWYLNKEGIDWLLKKELIDIILHLELEHTDIVESLLRSFKRRYTTLIAKDSRLERFIRSLSILHQTPEKVDELSFRESVHSQFSIYKNPELDIFLLSFYGWLKAKITKSATYDTTLDLIQRL